MPDNMRRLEEISLSLPEAERVDIEAWDGHPTFRVRGKNFVFCNVEATSLTVKLSKEEAEAVVATEPGASAAGYGLGRHGWVALDSAPTFPRRNGRNWRSGSTPRSPSLLRSGLPGSFSMRMRNARNG